MSDAPVRRSMRSKLVPKKFDYGELNSEPTRGKKRKAVEQDSVPVDGIEDILVNPKGKLASVDMTRLINANTWACVSPDARAILSTMLPSAAFPGFHADVCATHPATRVNVQLHDEQATQNGHVELDPAFLSSTFLEAALSTFQDSLVNGYFTKGHLKEAVEYEKGVRNGTLHAAWKDEKWDELQTRLGATEIEVLPKPSTQKQAVRLADLASKGHIRVGDIISYKRGTTLGVATHKDILVQSIHNRTHALTVLIPLPGVEDLPLSYLGPELSTQISNDVQRISVTTLAQLEYTIIDGARTVIANDSTDEELWSRFSLWRSTEQTDTDNQKGGRVLLSSLTDVRAAAAVE